MTFTDINIDKYDKLIGKGEDELGAFTVEGHMGMKEVKFVKTYIGSHQVNYEGTMIDDKITGTYS